jgi:succinoglycan biosynthesis protein ExoM
MTETANGNPASPKPPSLAVHISICICTFKRLGFLERLLNDIKIQETGDLFTYSVVVCDNDRDRTAEQTALNVSAAMGIALQYCVEPQQGIGFARNAVVRNASGDYLAFIDDDEFPEKNWLKSMFLALNQYGVDGVLGPVKPSFDRGVPGWIVKGRFYDRNFPSSGCILGSHQTRTGNVLLKRSVLEKIDGPFRPEFRAGEDVDFFRRAIDKGFRFAWCNEGVVFETVPPSRWKRTYLLRKALLRGACAALRPTVGWADISKSILAVVLYAFALPAVVFIGQHKFMDVMVRLCDHLGKLLALVGINPVREPYVAG